ncbi:hypothetical protein [Magnetospirillum aberrantis]|uniref:Uncharacterized protein n=1 Tax=Magnetospirillum aberrantis SpK TaxID=908842 RepID=A0A7C9UWA3_9PROT|nr:hypothetical protein [Magnetospirillum aberrantis]NFV79992.1 hypothetical protein [Magnetospirillum aberrantis SpK]
MAITYPLALPTATGLRTLGWKPRSVVGVSQSPFTLSQQVYAHQGEAWAIEATLPPQIRSTAMEWVAWRLSLRGRFGTFLLGDPKGRMPRGTIAATGIAVHGAHSARTRELSLQGGEEGATVLAGDYLQLGNGEETRLHMVLTPAAFDVSGVLTTDVWPALRQDYADATELVTRNCVGVFRMASNIMAWDIDDLHHYGIDFAAEEAL